MNSYEQIAYDDAIFTIENAKTQDAISVARVLVEDIEMNIDMSPNNHAQLVALLDIKEFDLKRIGV